MNRKVIYRSSYLIGALLLVTTLVTLMGSAPSVIFAQMEMMEMVIEDNNAYLMAMGEGSRIEIHAADRTKESWTQLATTAEAGSNQIVVEETGWEVGDHIAIASTSNNWTQAEEFTIQAISNDGKTITLDGELAFAHLGNTVNYDNGQEGEKHRSWDVEMRAEVALLNRNVTIQGDEDSVDDGFGGHTMIMNGAEQHISGAELYRMGQADLLGRYPIHWHMLGNAEGQYVEGISVHDTYQKGSTIHGTSNIRYEDNVIYDHVGHGVFFEDGSENDNQIYGNLVFSTQESQTALPIPTDGEHASSYWIENPNNAFIGNHAAGSESNGFWIFENQLHGLSTETFVGEAGQLHDLIFIGNTSHTGQGANGSSGTDKLLGIDGRITGNLDFQQSTLAANFGVVEGFTAYSGNVWSLTHEMVFSNSAFVDMTQFFTRHENIIKDSVITGGRTVLYRDGGNQYSDVLFADGARILPLSSDHVNTPGVFDNVVDGGSNVGFNNSVINQQVVADIDGRYTGIVGAFITPGGENGMFNAAPDANTFDNGFVSAYTIGATEVTALGINGDVRVLRSNGDSIPSLATSVDRRNVGDDNQDRSSANYEFYTTAGMPQDLAYLIDFVDAPTDLTLNLANVREGESVVYEVQNITSIDDVEGAAEVNSVAELVNSDVTAYMHDGDSVFIRIVANRVEVQPQRPVEDPLADYRAFGTITINGLVEGDNGDAGSREISTDLLNAIANMPERAAPTPPQVAPAAVNPNVSYIGYDIGMSEAESVHDVVDTAAHASFEVNYDVASRTVSINGEFADLSSDVTMMHLHRGAKGEAGGVISMLTVDSADDRNGTFSGTFTVSEDDAELFLAGDTYVNLHTVDNGPGELRGQVKVYAAGDFVLDRYESTSDTTVVTDYMPRWSQARTWNMTWDDVIPDAGNIVVIGEGQTVILDQSTTVKGIIVNGGELIIEDDPDLAIELNTDYLLVINGGLFQAGSEQDPIDTDFTLTLEGDDPEFDLNVSDILTGMSDESIIFAVDTTLQNTIND